MEGPSRIAILAAMTSELEPIRRRLGLAREERPFGRVYVGHAGERRVVAAVAAMGTEAATRVTNALLDTDPVDHVIVTGIAGGIAEGLALGDLVCPEVASLDGTGRDAHATPLGALPLRGRLLTTDVLYNDAASLERLRAEGHLVVDMETAAIGLAAEARGVPWTAFRAVSDFAGDAVVDADVVGLSLPDGTANPIAILRFMVTQPWRVPQLVRLGRGMRRAVRASSRAVLDALA